MMISPQIPEFHELIDTNESHFHKLSIIHMIESDYNEYKCE